MRIALVTNINGKGLQIDAELLQGFLEPRGHSVELVQFNQPWDGDADLGIMLEVVEPFFFPKAPRWWWFPNLEWVKPEYVPYASSFEWILAKTHDAERVLSEKFSNVKYTGFLTRDRMDSSIEREPRFLHLGGESALKNTAAVVSAWREWRYWYGKELDAELTVVSNTPLVDCPPTPGITYIKRATDEEIKRLQNSHKYHLLPSAYEGFGHALHEAQSVGAIILTTDAAPMSELDGTFKVPVKATRKVNLAETKEVSGKEIREILSWMMSGLGEKSRAQFEKGNAEFADNFGPLVDTPKPQTKVTPVKPKIALLGNFDPPHSTENDLLWTLRDMGYVTHAFQENRTGTEVVVEVCKNENVATLIWIHTHHWETPGKISLDEMLAQLHAHGTKTASFHLDRYVGLNQLDGRESRVGIHPFWRTDKVFTADGGNQEFFASRGVNHVWLPPGVVARDCHPGTFRKELASKVGFVGSPSYHPEYAFRGQLLDWLKETYKSDFRIYQGFRGEALNDVYASVDVVVGDSCFAGSDFYWSDRVPETIGRGGFLLHPQTKGLEIPGLAMFTPGDLDDLKRKIEYFLKRDTYRAELQGCAHAWVRTYETYTNRMQKLLSVMEVA